MSFLEAIILGIVQGVTEFLPVSSSGHLAILSALLHTNEETELLFEIMLHMGTLAAVIFAFRSDIRRMFWETLRMISDIFYNVKAWIHNKVQETDDRIYKKVLYNNYRKLVIMLVVSTVPTGIIGYVLRGIVKQMNHSLLACGSGLLITADCHRLLELWKQNTERYKSERSSYSRHLPGNRCNTRYITIGNHDHSRTFMRFPPKFCSEIFLFNVNSGDFRSSDT